MARREEEQGGVGGDQPWLLIVVLAFAAIILVSLFPQNQIGPIGATPNPASFASQPTAVAPIETQMGESRGVFMQSKQTVFAELKTD